MAASTTTPDPIDLLSDDELSVHIGRLHADMLARDLAGEPVDMCEVVPLSDKYVSKTLYNNEVDDTRLAMEKAAALGIAVPPIVRIVAGDREILAELIMERIHGVTLTSAWPRLGLIASVRVALQVRGMVRRMRSVKSPTAGSISTGSIKFTSMEDDRTGIPPHCPAVDFNRIVNFWANARPANQEAAKSDAEHFERCLGPTDVNSELVFTHGDLAPRNIMLEEASSKVWFIDWDNAGYYPAYFESSGMYNFNYVVDKWSWWARIRWRLLVWLATGLWRKTESDMLGIIEHRKRCWPWVRDYNARAGATVATFTYGEGGPQP